jgi:hypothetical protein
MGALPLAHPRGVVGFTEVVSVLRLREPATLPSRLPGRSTSLLRAILLTPAVAHIDREIIAAAQALTFSLVRHGSLA